MKKKASKRAETPTPSVQAKMPRRPELISREACLLAGRALRERVPHESHAAWKPTARPRDPIKLLELSSGGACLNWSPSGMGACCVVRFTFLRGSAGVMAADMATLPTTKVRVQACGDCHLLNFGMFATAERNLVFDINDFDETLPAPWEWISNALRRASRWLPATTVTLMRRPVMRPSGYPYLFSLAVRTNPFDEKASPIVE